MSGMEASLRAAQENADASRNLEDEYYLDRKNELGDEDPTDDPAEIEPAEDEQEYDWCNPPLSENPMFFETNDIDAVPPPIVVEYVNKPFAELHYLYNYLRVSNEDSCREYAQKQYGERLTDVDWLRVTLDGGERHQHRFEMADKPWNAPGQVELDGWGYFFGKVELPMVHYETRLKLFSANNKLRQAAVHRFHCGLSKGDLELAMMLPAILGDERRASETQQVYEAFILDPSTLDERTRAFVNTRLYTEDSEPVLIPELLSHIQTLLETSAFNYATEADPNFLKTNNFTVPQQIELQQYWTRWQTSNPTVTRHPNSLSTYPDPDSSRYSFRTTLTDIKELRNYATHRLFNADPEISSAGAIRKHVEWAKAFAVMVGDAATAEKVECIGARWLARYRPGASAA